ncbi:TPA: HAMP domain-containing histidine kinase [Clostridioides difficile]|nr:HAMP domain-containing histidine kinase [Clostridioides difficile]MCU5826274.1 HAMP domain-containing histidine kinase [Clostridioides difficile]HBG1705194.1 HAMP domain-containing histidine kinase [Clostridioides difficile]HBH0356618.1 HAMP domain-containing histidine kinase [Clostridioides difficile]HBH0360501.1 HAMP domain-containing histidine kinase [Clostridioides difficile]
MVFFLLVIIFALLLKIFYMRKAIKEIKRGFSEKLYTDTNTPIMLSSYDKLVSSLANDINVELKELQKQKHRYIQGDKELKNAITNISHDLRTPLTTICGYLSLLDKEEKSEHIARQLSIIKNRTFALKQLVEELFRYTTIISDTENSVYTETVINNVLEDCISSYYAIFKEKGITPNINLCEQKIVRSVDKTALLRIFNNVIDNAIKYSEGDLTISLFENGKIVFSNHTSDLNEIQIGKLFDRFYTVNTARKSTGLGLSIAKALIEKMDGNISADYSNNVLSIIIKLNEV